MHRSDSIADSGAKEGRFFLRSVCISHSFLADSSAWFSSHPLRSFSLPIPSLIRGPSVRPSVAISTPHLPFLVEMHEHLLSGRIRRAMCIFFYRVEQRDSSDLLRLIDKIRQLHNYHRFEKSPGALSLYARKKQGEELNGEFMRRCCRAKRSNAMLSMPRRARRVRRSAPVPPFVPASSHLERESDGK